MEVEFRAQIKECIQSEPFVEFVLSRVLPNMQSPDQAEKLRQITRELLQTFDRFEVGLCPFPLEGWFATNVAITLHSYLLPIVGSHSAVAQEHGDVGDSPTTDIEIVPIPAVLAARIVELCPPAFAAKVGGLCHINVTPGSELLNAYVERLVCDKNFFDEGYFLADGFLAGGADIPKQIECGVKHLSEKLFRDKTRIDDLERLLGRYSSQPPERDRISLMLLAMASDPELDAAAFDQGIWGSENVPWFLDRLKSYAGELIAQAEIDSEQAVSLVQQIGFVRLGSTAPEAVLLEQLSMFRQVIALSVRTRSAVRLFTATLGLARSFSSLYNRPEYRELQSPARKRLAVLAAPFKRSLETMERLIYFSCEDPDFVLKRRKS